MVLGYSLTVAIGDENLTHTMRSLNRSLLSGKITIVDTCVLHDRMGRIEDLVDFLLEAKAIPAITSIVLCEILGGGSERTRYLFPLIEKENILFLLRNRKLELFELPKVETLVERITEDLKMDFWRRYMQENSRDYLTALTALEKAQESNKKAIIITENILDFECWKPFGLDCLKSSEIDTIRYG